MSTSISKINMLLKVRDDNQAGLAAESRESTHDSGLIRDIHQVLNHLFFFILPALSEGHEAELVS